MTHVLNDVLKYYDIDIQSVSKQFTQYVQWIINERTKPLI